MIKVGGTNVAPREVELAIELQPDAARLWAVANFPYYSNRTRHRSPHPNGVVERWIESLKYERLHHHNTGRVPPAEAEDLHYRHQHSAHRAETHNKQPA